MSRHQPIEFSELFPPVSASRRFLQALGGLGCAGLILVALALLRAPRDSEAVAETYVAHQVALPFDELPPPPEKAPPELAPVVGLMRLEIVRAAASAVHIQIPDVPLFDAETAPPPARAVAAQFNLTKSVGHPVDDGDLLSRRIFNKSEVNQPPLVVYRVIPRISYDLVSNMATPRVVALLIVEKDGSVGDARLIHSSQVEDFDQAMLEALRGWQFSPAIRKGRKVRCWVQQAVSVKVAGGSPFEAH